MDIRKLIVSGLLLTGSTAHSAIDNQLIDSLDASRITLAGSIGQVAMFAVQADDDDDLEIFATASSTAYYENDYRKQGNDHWIVLDWDFDKNDYQIIATGELKQPGNYGQDSKVVRAYQASHQIDFQKILLGQNRGKLETIEFIDDPNANQHKIISTTLHLTDILPNGGKDSGLGFDPNWDGINSIVSLTGTDQSEYIILCTDGVHHAYDINQELVIASVGFLKVGQECLTGNIDYEKVNGQFDEELVISEGYVYTFDGINFHEKTQYHKTFEFEPKYTHLANIDDDLALELVQQMGATETSPGGSLLFRSAVNYKSIVNDSPWVLMPSTAKADYHFNVVDANADGIHEILFNYIDTNEDPNVAKIAQVGWDTNLDSHVIQKDVNSPLPELASFKYLPTTITNDIPADYRYFVTYTTGDTPSASKNSPLNPLLSRLNEDFSHSWSGLISTAAKSLDTIAKTQVGTSLNDYMLIQLEQANLDGKQDFIFTYKTFDINNFEMIDVVLPDYNNDEMMSVNVFSAFDVNEDGVDELYAAGQATYSDPAGILLSSNLDGSDDNRIDALENITNLQFGNFNDSHGPDIFASDYSGPGLSAAYLFYYDGNTLDQGDYETEGFFYNDKLDFNKAIPLNIKGDANVEILGINDKNLYSFNLNAGVGENDSYHLSGHDLTNFKPVKLNNRDYDYSLATSESGRLYLIEPKNMEVLALTAACDQSFSTLESIRLGTTNVVLAVCEQKLKSWIIEYDENILDYGYSFLALPEFDLGNVKTHKGQLIPLETDEGTTLIGLFKNQYLRFTLNNNMGEDSDNDGYPNYKDYFPNEISQWADADLDGLGDNPAPAENPDPSLNDIDNDGVLDHIDPDNLPENDFNPTNDNDNGAPQFVSALTSLSMSATKELTNVSLTTPTVTDVYHDANGLGDPIVTASVPNITLTDNSDTFVGDFESGLHSILWTATDNAGNAVSESQSLSIYPLIGFETNTSKIGEAQTSQIVVALSGSSPVYPVEVEITATLGTASNEDVNIDTSASISLSFSQGETQKLVKIQAIDENSVEANETLTLTINNTFPANTWTIDAGKSSHELTIVEANHAPSVAITISQNGQTTDLPTVLDGTVTLDATITDANADDTHTTYWNLASLGLSNSILEDVTFDPSQVAPGIYAISLTVTDNGLPNQTEIHSFNLTLDYSDSDGDTYKDNVDAFPDSPTEWSDSDGDGYSDQVGDRFPDDRFEYADDDNDGVGNNADLFDDDPTESADTDRDGVGDNADAFPNDPNETKDTDGDGVGDNADEFPGDAKRSNEVEDESASAGSIAPLSFLLILLPVLFARRKTH